MKDSTSVLQKSVKENLQVISTKRQGDKEN